MLETTLPKYEYYEKDLNPFRAIIIFFSYEKGLVFSYFGFV